MFRYAVLAVAVVVFANETASAEGEGVMEGYLYRVTLLQAAPGEYHDLIALYREQKETGAWEMRGEHPPHLIRHSQGDHWDFFLMQPIGSYEDYFSAENIGRRAAGGEAAFREALDKIIIFKEDLFAYGPSREVVANAFAENRFYHIEMFAALPGKHAELLHERQIENDYLRAIGNTENLIWIGDQGSDVDVFTIGFYPSIVEYAAPNSVSDEEANRLAVEAGFEGRGYIGSYLRELLASHHDTLAVAID